MSMETASTSVDEQRDVGAKPAVQAVNVHKIYRTGAVTVHALRGVDLTVERGEMVAIMGPSGCGKTTLLNCLSGLDTVSEGEVYVAGYNLADLTDNQRTDYRAKSMGFIFQTFNLLPVLSAAENVELPLIVSGVSPKQARAKALEMLEQVGLREWADHKPAELSGGQQQRVTVARALVNDPAIVWADEPTGALDSETAGGIIELIRELNEKNGQTFLLVTHDPRVASMCRRLVRMRDGEIVSDEAVERHGGGNAFSDGFGE